LQMLSINSSFEPIPLTSLRIVEAALPKRTAA
jgi:hypothetical protein